MQRVGVGAAIAVGGAAEAVVGVVGILVPESTMATKAVGVSLLALGASQVTEGLTMIGGANSGRGFNPLEESAALTGKALAGDIGERFGRYTFQVTNLVVSVGGAVKIAKVGKTQAALMKQVSEFKEPVTATVSDSKSIKIWEKRVPGKIHNQRAKVFGAESPWVDDQKVIELTISQDPNKTRQFFRIHESKKDSLGRWMMTKNPKAYSKYTVKNRLALPRSTKQMKMVTVLEPPPGTKLRVRVGRAGANKFGEGNWTQIEVLGTIDESWIKNSKPWRGR